jgi:hypothetical protein
MSGFLRKIHEKNIAAKQPAQPANAAVVKTRPKGPGFAESTEPPLNPNQPKKSKNTPIAANDPWT